ncbi:ATP synthase subunit gamma [Salmonella enterica subsp. enterica]|uniref:ATP synthase subunit gamma n=1 Tax=Salmonella enterica I TaxID=59201 RepID=A0A3S4LSF8_SALET|nr:ATP synthase subunit gamma [Salmonella enterica subsp. enterica]
MGDNPSLSELIGPVKVMLQAYDEGRLDKLYIVSNKFINTMSQVPTITQLLPLPASEDDDLKRKAWDYLYEPDPKALLDTLLRRLCGVSGLSGRGRKPGQRAGPHEWWR